MSIELAEHGIRTARLAEGMAERIGLSRAMVRVIADAAATHDVGKYLLPRALLDKPSSLTRTEHELMQGHCAMGAWVLLRESREPGTVRHDAAVALLHHEWWNGRGYPFGLAGRRIPLGARIVAVADVFDALRSERAYKSAWPEDLALDYIRARSGIQFDPECVEALLDVAPALQAAWLGLSREPAEATRQLAA